MTEFAKLQNGSDIRGVALPLAAQEPVNLTEEAVEQIARAHGASAAFLNQGGACCRITFDTCAPGHV